VILGKSTCINSSFDITDPDLHVSNCSYVERELHNQIQAKIALLDSEGGFYQSESKYRERINSNRLDGVDYYLAWGKDAARIIKKESRNLNTHVTGNPRFDLLQSPYREIYKKESKRLRKKFGNYVIINTNFALANHESCENPPENTYNVGSEEYNNTKTMFKKFLDMIHRLGAEFSEPEIIVRPHPGENKSTYEQQFGGNNNISVIHEGNVHKWICGASVVIHNGCTTGIESALLNKPVLAYDPKPQCVPNGQYNMRNNLSIRVPSIEELLDEVKKIMRKGNKYYYLNSEQKKVLKGRIFNIDCLSVERIADVIDSINVSSSAENRYNPVFKEKIKRFLSSNLGHKNITRIRETHLRSHWSTSNQKFSYISDSDIQTRINLFSEYLNTSNIDFERIPPLENTFHIYS
jgi:surface carbohydrate biosynthesis protein